MESLHPTIHAEQSIALYLIKQVKASQFVLGVRKCPKNRPVLNQRNNNRQTSGHYLTSTSTGSVYTIEVDRLAQNGINRHLC